jgi:hypothetical protein
MQHEEDPKTPHVFSHHACSKASPASLTSP